MQQRKIAILPARGGSKRLPRKNILPVNGFPMIAYPIRAALLTGIFSDVVVSTEDDEIREISERHGATVAHRPVELSQDKSSVADVCAHVLSLPQYHSCELFCCIYATALFVKPENIVESMQLLHNEPEADYVMGVSNYNYHPVQALRSANGYLSYMWPEYEELKSQDYPELKVSNGTLYWARTENFLRDQTFYGERLKGYELEAVDIDTERDYEEAKRVAANSGLKLT